jgi:hypothetical protein
MATDYLDARIAAPQSITIPTLGQPVTTWRDIEGRAYTSGDVLENGMIVGEPGKLINAGIVWVSREKLAAAQEHGWAMMSPEAPGELVMVRR